MKILLITFLLFIVSCERSNTNILKKEKSIFLTDSKSSLIKNAEGEEIKCSEKKFDEMICIPQDDMYFLFKKCGK